MIRTFYFKIHKRCRKKRRNNYFFSFLSPFFLLLNFQYDFEKMCKNMVVSLFVPCYDLSLVKEVIKRNILAFT